MLDNGLRRLRHSASDTLDPTALENLLDTDGPGSIARRDDLTPRTERIVWAARRTG